MKRRRCNLQPLSLRPLRDHLSTGCRKILRSLSHWMSQKFYKHSSSDEYSNLAILLKPVNDKFHNIWSVILNHSMIYNDTVKLSNGTEQHNSTRGIFSNFVVTSSLKMEVRNTTYSSSHALYNMM